MLFSIHTIPQAQEKHDHYMSLIVPVARQKPVEATDDMNEKQLLENDTDWAQYKKSEQERLAAQEIKDNADEAFWNVAQDIYAALA
jgi:hypothetical protein